MAVPAKKRLHFAALRLLLTSTRKTVCCLRTAEGLSLRMFCTVIMSFKVKNLNWPISISENEIWGHMLMLLLLVSYKDSYPILPPENGEKPELKQFS
uniref:Uncharacterized protein n=1 Tax=Oryza brachyantha TaxID=4533 RepID=J3L797_ORYBR